MNETVRIVNPLDVMRKSLRFDLIFKVELADAWLHGDEASAKKAEEAYLESIRARNGFRESEPPKSGPAIYIRAFRQTLASISAHGYDEKAPPIPVDRNGELLGGAHRLSSCIVCGCPCRIVQLPQLSPGNSMFATFRRGKIAAAVANWGMLAYLRRFPDGRLADEFAANVVPDAPFPDWEQRVRELSFDSRLWRLREKCYLFKSFLRRGVRRAKSLKNADECRHRAAAPLMLARYLKERGQEGDAEGVCLHG